MNTPYEVALLIPELSRERLAPADHIAAEVRFAAALERACADTGGVLETYVGSEYRMSIWAQEDRNVNEMEPETEWKAAMKAAEAAAWANRRKPAGSEFMVRVATHVPQRSFWQPSDVPF